EARDVNWYRYVNNSPLNYTDPEGKVAWAAILGILSTALHTITNYILNKMPDCAKKCKDDCIKCCDSLGGWAHAAKGAAYMTANSACVGLFNPWLVSGCMAAVSSEYFTGAQNIQQSILSCKSSCK
ncbi:MAG: hypothetical protein NZM04_00285, partial [Methylacidiphilales bacterium]|nr:hypothetical protein [Candidatus Methylacidiphilales bacterium]